jgi:hypothetical protein
LSFVFLLPAASQAAFKCEGMKMLAYAKAYSCVTTAQAKSVKTLGKQAGAGQPQCTDKMAVQWAKAESYGCLSDSVISSALNALTTDTDDLTDLLAPGAPAPSACSSLKIKSAGKYAACRLKVERAFVVAGKARDFTKCDAKLSDGFAKAEALAAGDCLTGSDVETARSEVTGDADFIVLEITSDTTTTQTTVTTTTSTTLPSQNDDFEAGSLDPSWTVLNPAIATVSVASGQLHLQVNTASNWFNSTESVLVYKLVTGDFDVHTTVHATKTSNLAEEPDPQFRLGGLLARDPASSPANSNFVHVALGAGSFAVPVASEDKTTDDSSSVYTFHPIVVTEGDIRLRRVGDDFSMYYRPIGNMTWSLLGTHTRADLPATLQIGLMAYDPNGSPDITAHFDEIVFD